MFKGHKTLSVKVFLMPAAAIIFLSGCASIPKEPGPYRVRLVIPGMPGVVRGMPGTTLSFFGAPPPIFDFSGRRVQDEEKKRAESPFEMTYSSAYTPGGAASRYLEQFWESIHDDALLHVYNNINEYHANVVVEYDEETHSVRKKVVNVRYPYSDRYYPNPYHSYEIERQIRDNRMRK